jgi:molecular chaperone HtpG
LPIIPPPPPDISSCRLHARLLELSTPTDGLAERVETFFSAVKPLLELIIAGPFREYTLHNPAHAKKLVHLAEFVIDPATVQHLTTLDLTVFLIASHLHDLGMCLTSSERASILASPEFEDELRSWPELWDNLVATRNLHHNATGEYQLALEARLFQLQEAALASYLRSRHATRERYLQLTGQIKEMTGRSDLFTLHGVSFEEELISVCVSHNQDASVLLETIDPYTDRFPRALPIGGVHLNLQFCAAVLRIVDILDFDRERTPRILFEALGIDDRELPGSSVTLKEWNKHMAVHSLELKEDELVIYADSQHPTIERSIRDFCATMEREIRDTLAVLGRNPANVLLHYKLNLPQSVRPHVRAVGYIYKDLTFHLDESAVSKLLMGESLYPNRAVALRELVQNGIDACQVRSMVEGASSYSPAVTVLSELEEDGRTWLVVRDNGIGMDESVLSRYFFRVGTSYYTSAEFERLATSSGRAFVPISRFGIGILSVFMVGDKLEVHTRNLLSSRRDTAHRVVRIDGRKGLAFVTEDEVGPQGTTIRLRLIQRSTAAARVFLSEGASYLRETVRRPVVPVEVNLPPVAFDIHPSAFLSLREDAAQRLEQAGLEAVVLDVGRWSTRITGRVILFFHRRPDNRLVHRLERFAMKDEAIKGYLKNYGGNRITVNGISMILNKTGRVLGSKERRLAGAIDVEIRGDMDVKYDVARNRLVEEGSSVARREIRSAVVSGLKEMGIADRLDDAGREALDPVVPTIGANTWKVKPVTNEAVLDAVQGELPVGKWPFGLHRIIAARLDISASLAHRAISTLIELGRVQTRSRPAGVGSSDAPEPSDETE